MKNPNPLKHPLEHFNDEYDKKITAAKAAGWISDQKGAFKKGHTDTATVSYYVDPKTKEYAGVKKPKK